MNKIIIATATAAATAAATILWGSILASQSARAWGTWVVETHEYKDASYSIHDFNSIAGGRDLRVVVRGNPTGASQADFEQAVIALMNDHQPGLPVPDPFHLEAHRAGARELQGGHGLWRQGREREPGLRRSGRSVYEPCRRPRVPDRCVLLARRAHQLGLGTGRRCHLDHGSGARGHDFGFDAPDVPEHLAVPVDPEFCRP